MKHFHLFIIFMAMPPCTAMKNICNSNISVKLTFEKLFFAQHLANDRVIIGQQKNHSIWGPNEILIHIVNPINNEPIKEIKRIDTAASTSDSIRLAVHPNKKKFVLSYDYTVEIYNAETGKKEWSYDDNDKRIYSSIFSTLDNSIVMIHNGQSIEIIKYNYETNQHHTIKSSFLCPTIALHPLKNSMCAGNKREIFLYSLDQLDVTEPTTIESDVGYVENYQYTHDGSFIIAQKFSIINIIDPLLAKRTNCCSMEQKKHWNYCTYCGNLIEKTPFKKLTLEDGDDDVNYHKFCKMVLYPESLILATLSCKKNYSRSAIESYESYTLKYWHLLTQSCIYSAPILETKWNPGFDSHYDLSFSPDKKELLITLDNKCIALPVPLAIYHQALFIYLILKNYSFDGQNLPYDLARVITIKFHDILEHSIQN